MRTYRNVRCSKTQMNHEGAYMLNRKGELFAVNQHSPSAAYQGRDILELAPADADFLWTLGFITEDEAKSILLNDFLRFSQKHNINEFSTNEISTYLGYGEIRRSPKIYELFIETFNVDRGNVKDIEALLKSLPSYRELNSRWYKFLLDNYVRVYRYEDNLDFRIQSEGFDWNRVIIDKVLLNTNLSFTPKEISIVRENPKGYRVYFDRKSLNYILENDKTILSSQLYERNIVNGKIQYIKVKE